MELELGIGIAAALVAAGISLDTVNPQSRWWRELTYHGPRNVNQVAITFDDGPNEGFTLKIRDILDAHGVKATFFAVGKAIEARPDIVTAVLDKGHLLANHSFSHKWRHSFQPGYPEMKRAEDVFKRDLGISPRFFRPPHGTHTYPMVRTVDKAGMQLVTWDVMAWDWNTQDGDLIAKRVLKGVKPGSIILLHDGVDGNLIADRSGIIQALPQILDGLGKRGLEPVRLDTLLGGPAYLD